MERRVRGFFYPSGLTLTSRRPCVTIAGMGRIELPLMESCFVNVGLQHEETFKRAAEPQSEPDNVLSSFGNMPSIAPSIPVLFSSAFTLTGNSYPLLDSCIKTTWSSYPALLQSVHPPLPRRLAPLFASDLWSSASRYFRLWWRSCRRYLRCR